MKRGNNEFSDSRVTIFLIGAVLISLVSTWTILISLNQVTSAEETQNQQISQESQQSSSGVISLTILEKEKSFKEKEEERINAHKQ